MKYAIFAFCALLLVACSQTQPQEPSTPIDTIPAVEEKTTEPAQPEEMEEATVTTAFDGLPTDMNELLDNGRERLTTGYSYRYNQFDDGEQSTHAIEGSMVYQKGDLVKILLPEPKQRINPGTYFDTVYIDRDTETAQAQCERHPDCSGKNLHTVPYENYLFMTPADWIANMEDPVKVEERTIQDHKAVRLDATVDGKQSQIWVDRFSGVPIQVEVGTTEYVYAAFSVGIRAQPMTP
jgi:hypothetical protein